MSVKDFIETKLKDKVWDVRLSITANASVEESIHRGRLNLPTQDEVAILFPDDITAQHQRNVILNYRAPVGSSGLRYIPDYHRMYDATQYPTLFVKGQDGWHLDLDETCLEHTNFMIVDRMNDDKEVELRSPLATLVVFWSTIAVRRPEIDLGRGETPLVFAVHLGSPPSTSTSHLGSPYCISTMAGPRNKKKNRRQQLAEARLKKKQKADAAAAESSPTEAANAANAQAVDQSDADARGVEADGGTSGTAEPSTAAEDARRAKQAEARRKQRETIAAPRDFCAEQAAAAAAGTSDAHARGWETRRANDDARRADAEAKRQTELDSLRRRMERQHREAIAAAEERMSAEREATVNAEVEKFKAGLLAELSTDRVDDSQELKELESICNTISR
ncbi:hypothetical protein THAOC_07454 [Thalassiosira oceanica]|uniref:Uncharacterized protein n=1 Tax=Thalassiosira oceanica TaxID=159749 RepID=K0SXI0_THAOC|nr:hypothetical protein THAOC_07454 [Thalassiosira oceanica]|eukprot:EJK71133.1 hypothetical protein THAOC_07454 [Thalassiosira oceanica]